MSATDLYKNLCHGDPALVERLLDAESNTIRLEPTRTAATRAVLLITRRVARDQVAAIAAAAGIH
ncbi:MAG: hypothetical protein ACR2NB_14120 [Solirubrobacteraceae bacterium]